MKKLALLLNTKKHLIPILSGITLILFALYFIPVLYTLFFSPNMYTGIYIHDTPVGGLSKKEATDLLEKKLLSVSSEAKITLLASTQTKTFHFRDAKVKYFIRNAVEEAYSIGRRGTMTRRFLEISKTKTLSKNIPVSYEYQKDFVNGIVEDLAKKIKTPMVENQLLIQPNEYVKLKTGSIGKYFEVQKVLALIEQNIALGTSSTIEIPIIYQTPKPFQVEELMNSINTPPVNAYVVVEKNSPKTIDHVVGRTIQRKDLEQHVDWIKNYENKEITLPVAFVEPKIRSDEVSNYLFRDVLGTVSTKFGVSTKNDSNRAINIGIAVSKLNGKLIPPKAVLSFNDYVGPREKSAGYQDAHTYVSGKIVDGTGGGICQVSTTLYNAGIKAGLEIKERHNHMFTVGYVPFGADAAVAYGSADLKMKNTTSWPIRIHSWVTPSNTLYIELKGTNEFRGRTYELIHKEISATNITTEKISDTTLNEGTQTIEQYGMKGYVIDTFKVVKQDGKIVQENKMYRSTYQMHPKQIKIGTKKEKPLPTPPVTSAPAPAPAPTPSAGVDDAGNPPVTSGTPLIQISPPTQATPSLSSSQ